MKVNENTKFLVPVVTRPTWAKLEGSVESDYRNMRLKWNPKQDAHSLEAFVHQVSQNTTNPLSPTTQLKRTMSSTGLKRQ